ncbi:hypothetical protein [Pandoraea sputorum]|uniref:hypothetical protein n=1 Tax=Pandoraea sputorum TaxID=93222 RepID=UPI001242E758|nr:hypothetical protein [Pandoraea sputorum]VVE07386.1 hypothetical protein PSP20601_02467 [Pandoraea sputorum]
MPDNKTVTFDASAQRVVPLNPTDAQLTAIAEANSFNPYALYAAMIAAAPTPAAQSAGQEAVAWRYRDRKTEKWGFTRHHPRNFVRMPKFVEPLYAAPVNGGERYAELEREHFGDPDKRTGIYAERAADAQQVGTHERDRHSDDKAVDLFASAMKKKLAEARLKGRRGWQTCRPDDLSKMLREHVDKGDPRDVANFCMFLWMLGAPIYRAALASPEKVGGDEWENLKGWRFEYRSDGDMWIVTSPAGETWTAFGKTPVAELVQAARAALSADGGEESPSLTNPLTPYGMLVRALRIVTDTTLMEMARHHNVSPSLLSGMEFGRKPVTIDDAIAASKFFSEHGVAGTLGALTVALQAAIAANQVRKGE